MIIHSPIISGSLTFAEGATFTMPDNGVYSGSFSGSYIGDTFTGGTFTGDGSSLTFGGTGLVSGSSQIEFNEVNNTPFSQSLNSVTTTKSIIPTTTTIDLGSVASPFRDLYLSSASLYIDGQQVISTANGDLNITTDANQSLRLIEEGSDTITLQTADGDITLTATGTGNIELDAPVQIAAGKNVLSSDGNAISFANSISVTGDISITGTVDGVDVASLKSSVDAILDSSDADKDSFAEIVALINSVDTTNDNAFASFYTASNDRLTSLEAETGSISTAQNAQNARLTSLEAETGSISTAQNAQNARLTSLEVNSGSLETQQSIANGRLSSLEITTASIATAQGIQDSRLDDLESFSSSLEGGFVNNAELAAATGALETAYTAQQARLTLLEIETGSISTTHSAQNARLTSIEGFTSSIDTTIKTKLDVEGVISGSSQILGGSGLVSGSSQIDVTATTNFSTFSSSLDTRIDSL